MAEKKSNLEPVKYLVRKKMKSSRIHDDAIYYPFYIYFIETFAFFSTCYLF
jgi:hypothetical protein